MKTITEQKQTRNVKRETWHNEKITQSLKEAYIWPANAYANRTINYVKAAHQQIPT